MTTKPTKTTKTDPAADATPPTAKEMIMNAHASIDALDQALIDAKADMRDEVVAAASGSGDFERYREAMARRDAIVAFRNDLAALIPELRDRERKEAEAAKRAEADKAAAEIDAVRANLYAAPGNAERVFAEMVASTDAFREGREKFGASFRPVGLSDEIAEFCIPAGLIRRGAFGEPRWVVDSEPKLREWVNTNARRLCFAHGEFIQEITIAKARRAA